jgi:hypothetical protein
MYYRGEDLPVFRAIIIYVGPFLVLLGTIGNCGTLIVMGKTIRLKSRSTSVYPLTVAALSLLAVHLRLLDHMLTMHGLDLRSLNYPSCKVVASVLYAITALHLWVCVNLAVERVIALYHRSRGLFENDNHTICVFLVGTSLVVISFNVTYMPTYEQHLNGSWMCDAGENYYSPSNAWFWAQYAVQWALPSLLMFSCVILVSGRLVYSYYKKKHAEVITYVSKLKMCGVTLSMLIIHGLLLISTISQVVALPMMVACVQRRGSVELCPNHHEALLCSEFFMNFNYVINVVVMLVCVKPFRQTVLDMCSSKASKEDNTENTADSNMQSTSQGY